MARDRRNVGRQSLKRHVGTRQPRKTLLVFCEGKETEPQYLKALKQQPAVRDFAAVDIRVETGQGDSPMTLVAMAIEARQKAKGEDSEIDEVWCVFDVEWPRSHPFLKDATEHARQGSVEVAISNPCFELWLILHLQDHRRSLSNDDARRLRRKLDRSSGKGLDPAKYMPHVREAARRAASLDENHFRNGTSFPEDNPSSGMHRLLASVGVLAGAEESDRRNEGDGR